MLSVRFVIGQINARHTLRAALFTNIHFSINHWKPDDTVRLCNTCCNPKQLRVLPNSGFICFVWLPDLSDIFNFVIYVFLLLRLCILILCLCLCILTVMYDLLFVFFSLCCVLFHCVVLCTFCVQMCAVQLPPVFNPIAVSKYICLYLTE
jgi:hypothetical protein